MHRTFAGALASLTSLALVGCGAAGSHKPVDFSQGVPSKQQAQVQVPSSSSSGLADPSMAGAGDQLVQINQAMKMAIQGQTSDLYRLTKGATYLVNGATEWVLVALAAGVARKPTSVSGSTAVYGPYTPYLSEITWKLTVTRTEFNVFTYLLEGQDHTTPSGPWVEVMSGSHTVTVDENDNVVRGFGQGVFLIEWDKARTLPGRGADTGTCEVHYGKVDPKSDAFVDVSLNNVNGDGQPFNAEYRFALQPSQAGKFEFALDINLQPFTAGMEANERWAIDSRWMSTGAGRSDVTAHGGDLLSPITVNECWDAAFLSTYYAKSDEPASGYGMESQACAFAGATYSAL
ncbi:MAG TPA: hypothetical protein VND93_16975 [Myxococcales bacterium]|jgi:hypothetical protein|nr:hypothetical protein [Myxococcales bacterium]